MTDQKALIYCRVSDVKQTTRGDGLASQETRCREFARARGYSVINTYKDDKSGNLIDRPGMKAMLAYLRKHKKENLIVIIDDISRLARGIPAHWKLRTSIAKAGGMLESPSVTFGDDADSDQEPNASTGDEWLLDLPTTTRLQIQSEVRTGASARPRRTVGQHRAHRPRGFC